MTDQNALQNQIAKGTDKEEGVTNQATAQPGHHTPQREPQDLMPE